jgi:Protein of unknown function (DUF4089)
MPLDTETYVDSQAALLGITLAPEHRPGVLRYLQMVMTMAPRVMDFAGTLKPEDESGNSFVPVAPRLTSKDQP